jgi:hypothetical protein
VIATSSTRYCALTIKGELETVGRFVLLRDGDVAPKLPVDLNIAACDHHVA